MYLTVLNSKLTYPDKRWINVLLHEIGHYSCWITFCKCSTTPDPNDIIESELHANKYVMKINIMNQWIDPLKELVDEILSNSQIKELI